MTSSTSRALFGAPSPCVTAPDARKAQATIDGWSKLCEALLARVYPDSSERRWHLFDDSTACPSNGVLTGQRPLVLVLVGSTAAAVSSGPRLMLVHWHGNGSLRVDLGRLTSVLELSWSTCIRQEYKASGWHVSSRTV
eukprot:2411142-Amphidinium_carterae.1